MTASASAPVELLEAALVHRDHERLTACRSGTGSHPRSHPRAWRSCWSWRGRSLRRGCSATAASTTRARVDSSLTTSPRRGRGTGRAERRRIDRCARRVRRLERERVGEREAVAAAVEVEHLGRPRRWVRCRATSARVNGSSSSCGHDVVDEPDPQRFVGVDEVAGDRQLGRLAHAHGTRQQRGEPPRGDDVEPRVRVGEARPLRRHDERAAQRELERAGDARAVDRAHDGRGRGPQRRARVAWTTRSAAARGDLLEVDAGAEHRVDRGDDRPPAARRRRRPPR